MQVECYRHSPMGRCLVKLGAAGMFETFATLVSLHVRACRACPIYPSTVNSWPMSLNKQNNIYSTARLGRCASRGPKLTCAALRAWTSKSWIAHNCIMVRVPGSSRAHTCHYLFFPFLFPRAKCHGRPHASSPLAPLPTYAPQPEFFNHRVSAWGFQWCWFAGHLVHAQKQQGNCAKFCTNCFEGAEEAVRAWPARWVQLLGCGCSRWSATTVAEDSAASLCVCVLLPRACVMRVDDSGQRRR